MKKKNMRAAYSNPRIDDIFIKYRNLFNWLSSLYKDYRCVSRYSLCYDMSYEESKRDDTEAVRVVMKMNI